VADPEDRQADGDHGQAGQRASEIRDVDRDERAAADVPEPDAQRERDQHRHADRDRRQLDLLEHLRAEQPAIVPDETEPVDERVAAEGCGDDHDAVLCRDHGVIPRCTTTSTASATSASAIASAPRRPQAKAAAISTPAQSATKLDCENEK
jgi:hypothetical protein